jgi:hypothetical protein
MGEMTEALDDAFDRMKEALDGAFYKMIEELDVATNNLKMNKANEGSTTENKRESEDEHID